jgi:hypothetical protein
MTKDEVKAWLATRTPQDIIKSLRGEYQRMDWRHGMQDIQYPVTPLQKTAADLLERLLAENAELRDKLEQIKGPDGDWYLRRLRAESVDSNE